MAAVDGNEVRSGVTSEVKSEVKPGRSAVKKLALTLTSEEEDVRKIVLLLRPTWQAETITVKKVLGGLINQLWKAYTTTTTNNNEKEEKKEDKDDVIAVKIFGTFGGDDGEILDREKEKVMIEEMHDQGVSLPVYAIFENGFAYKFAAGANPTKEDILDPKFRSLLVAELHRIHSFRSSASSSSSSGEPPLDYGRRIFLKCDDMWNKHRQPDDIVNKLFHRLGTSIEEISKELGDMMSIYDELCKEFPSCFCHMDAHPGNLIYSADKGLSAVDWETAGLGMELVDAAAFFMTYVNHEPANHKMFSEHRDYIEEFMKEYLATHPMYKHQQPDPQTVQTWLTGLYKTMYITGVAAVAYLVCQPMEEDDFFFKLGLINYQEMKEVRDYLRARSLLPVHE